MWRRAVERLVARARSRPDPWQHLDANVLEVRSLAHLKLALGWRRDPILDAERINVFLGLNDLNDRRLRDAEVIAGACANEARKIALEIGTGAGLTTTLMAENAPQATLYTVNIPPEEIAAGGVYTTFAPSRDQIGRAWRERKLENVVQILANTATWEPDFGPIDVALIDGCHDAEFVYGDTSKVLAHSRPGSLILWHDFHPALRSVYPWIASVCRGIERLYRERRLRGPILHLQDSWVGLYRVPPGAEP
jgi:predicted O-methyltransferase YrrM